MDQNWFFRWIWRFNAVALAVVLIAAGIGLALPFLAWQLAPAVERAVDATQPKQEPPKYGLTLESARAGRTEIVLALDYLHSPERGLGSFSKDAYARRIANYLFVDAATGAHRWLFPTNDQMVTRTEYLTDTPSPYAAEMSGPGALRTVYYVVVPGSGRIGNDAKYQVYLSKPNGEALTKILEDLDEAPSAMQLDADNLAVSYKLKGRIVVARVSLKDFKTTLQVDVSSQVPK